MAKLNLVSKITVSTLDAQPKAHSVKEDTHVATIYGRCTKKEVGQTQYGDFVKFGGEFEGVNAQTGEAYRAGTLIVPQILEALLDNAINVDENNAVDFAVEVWVKPSEKSKTGYVYGIKPLIEPAESDALAQLRNLAKAPALAAPKE